MRVCVRVCVICELVKGLISPTTVINCSVVCRSEGKGRGERDNILTATGYLITIASVSFVNKCCGGGWVVCYAYNSLTYSRNAQHNKKDRSYARLYVRYSS